MKILLVAMRSIHTIRWVSQLKDSGHEVHWFDILNGGHIAEWDWVTQHTNWRYKFGDFKGRFFFKKYLPKVHALLENDTEKEFERILKKVKPDVVQSIVMYNCAVPIYTVMQRNKKIKWIYSAWGNDLFYYQNVPAYKKNIVKVLPEIDYMFADCKRDITIAKNLGLGGKALGVFPGGGGYKLETYSQYETPVETRKIILVKGYEQRFGKAIQVLQALQLIREDLKPYKVVVFGADTEFYEKFQKLKDSEFIQVLGTLAHHEVLELMGKSLIYIGNSSSDGMPNTLLEAIIMGAFPIQSNPGGASAEIIEDNKNGLLIENCEDVSEIRKKILFAISNREFLKNAMKQNRKVRETLCYNVIQKQVLSQYNLVAKEL